MRHPESDVQPAGPARDSGAVARPHAATVTTGTPPLRPFPNTDLPRRQPGERQKARPARPPPAQIRRPTHSSSRLGSQRAHDRHHAVHQTARHSPQDRTKNLSARTRDDPARSSAPNRRGITSGGQHAAVTLGYSESNHQAPQVALPGALCLVGQESQGLLAAPQNPHKSATRRLIPTGIPRTKRHTPVHLLCVLKTWRTAGQHRRCA